MSLRYLSASELASPAHTFFAIGDHQNLRRETVARPLTAAEIRFALNFQLLFSQKIFFIAEDMLVNERLMGLLLNDYRDTLRDGLFVPLLRDSHDSLLDCRQYLEAHDYYNQTGDAIWREYLDAIVRIQPPIGRFSEEDAYEHFTAVARGYFADADLLKTLGVDLEPAEIDKAVTQILRESGRKFWRRSALYHFADRVASAGLPIDARKIRQLASVVYMAHFGGLLGQVGVFPNWYAPYVSKLTALDITPGVSDGRSEEPAIMTLEAVLPNSRREDLAALALADIYELREDASYQRYVTALSRYRSDTHYSADAVLRALVSYLGVIDAFIAERQSGLVRRAKPRRLSLGLVRHTAALGTLLAIADVATGGQWTPGIASDAGIAGSALICLVLGGVLGRQLREVEQRRRDYWNDYCGADGTFSAQISKMRRLQT